MVRTHSTLFTIYIATAFTLYFHKEFEHAQKVKTNVYRFKFFFKDGDNTTFWLSGLNLVSLQRSLELGQLCSCTLQSHNITTIINILHELESPMSTERPYMIS